MKKLLVVLLALAVLGTMLTAEAKLSVGAWGRMFMSPVGSNGTDQITNGASATWGGGGRVGVSFNGSSDNVGFAWNPGVNGSGMTAVCDQAKIFAKINDMVTVQLGVIQGDVLRGKIGNSGTVLSQNAPDEDAIFTRFYPGAGILLDITPVPGFYLGASIDAPSGGTAKTSDAFKAIQIGAGYTIEGLGMIRAQFIGEGGPKAVKNIAGTAVGNGIQVAFQVTAVQGLNADIGFTYRQDATCQQSLDVGVSYGKDAISLMGRVDANFGGKLLGVSGKFNADAMAQAFYAVADPLSVGVEARLMGMSNLDSAAAPDAKVLAVMPMVKLGYSNGYLKVGFDANVGLDGQDLTYMVPIQLEYWF